MSGEPRDVWQEIRTTQDETEATIIQGLLEENGIPCRVDSSRVSQLPVAFGKLGELRVFVLEQDAERAEALLAEAAPDAPDAAGTED